MSSPTSTDRFTYNLLGRIVQQDNVTMNKSISYQYDAVGNLLSLTNSEDRTTRYAYDNRYLMTQMIDPDDSVTIFEYDGLGRETVRKLANGNTIVKKYNPDGTLDQIENRNQDGIISSFNYEYDAYGNRIRQIEEDGAETRYIYDDLNRLIEVNYPLEKILSLRKDPNTPQDTTQQKDLKQDQGPTDLTDPTQNEKNNKNNNSKNTDKNEEKSNNVKNNLTSSIERNGFIYQFELLAFNNGNGNSDKAKGKGKKAQDNALYGEGFEETEPFYLIDRPGYLLEPQSKVQYTYDAVGNRLSMTNDQGIIQYKYNAADQLIQSGDTQYTYDGAGNLIQENGDRGEIQYLYNGANQLTEVLYQDESYAKYQYDAMGRKIYREEATWDYTQEPGEGQSKENNGKGQEKRNEKAQTNGKGNGSSKNNGKGNGYSKYNNPGQGLKLGIYKNGQYPNRLDITKSRYQYEGLSNLLLKEYGDKGSPYAEYYLGPMNQVVSRKMFGLHGLAEPGHDPELKTTGGLMYYQYDGLNTVSELTDRHGDIIERYRYDAFGGIFTGITAPYNRIAFTGQEYDEKTGLIDLNARMYNPVVGRFMSADTYPGTLANPLSQNRYAYVMNNPINMWDPTGHVPEWVRNRSSHYSESESSSRLVVNFWDFIDYYSRDTGWQLQRKERDQKYYYEYYKKSVYEQWDYVHHRVVWDKIVDEETGSEDLLLDSYNYELVEY
ncbi:MAG: RHS repeat-associated core domain-containing protein [Tepidibacillus sp.]